MLAIWPLDSGPFRPCFRLRPEQRRMGFRLRQDFGGRVGGTGKVYESENDGF